MTNNLKPQYIAYNVIEGKASQKIWNRVGAGWDHKDGEGINIKLTAFTLSGNIILRTPKSGDDE